jgi:hypothetical protein
VLPELFSEVYLIDYLSLLLDLLLSEIWALVRVLEAFNHLDPFVKILLFRLVWS